MNPAEYRPGVGIYLYNTEGKVFVGRRIDESSEAWQMPQGGIDDGEDELQAMYRELYEEIGVEQQFVELTKVIDDWQYYNLPESLTKTLWQGRYKGQRQKWYALKFLGTDKNININAHNPPEFKEWKWLEPTQLPSLIVDFKKPLYEFVVKKFA